MRKKMALALGGVSLALFGTAAMARVFERDLKVMEAWLGGRAAGEPVNCIQTPRIRDTYYVGETTILFKMDDGTVYRNDPPGGCAGLNSNSGLITQTPTTRLCQGDIARVQDFGLGFPGGGCAFGEFVPYKKASS